ncbi:MAG: hypothetical protein J7L96_05205 [Bacteroidales bacterium]|nr:hypothetical protein [Bacteroidales bacterium]
MKKIAFRCFALFFLTLLLAACKTSTDQSPNVLLISIDDLNNWIEPLGGHPQALTPSLSKLRKESLA